MARKSKPAFSASSELLSQISSQRKSMLGGLTSLQVETEEKVRTIPLKLVDTNGNPRKTFNKNSIVELAKSIESVGLINPITVREISGRYELITGERRFRAVKFLKRKEIRAIIEPVDVMDPANYAEVKLIENIQRENLNDLELAYALVILKKKNSNSNQELAKKIGMTEQWVKIKIAHAQSVENLLSLGFIKNLDHITDIPTTVWQELQSILKEKPKEVLDWLSEQKKQGNTLKQRDAREYAQSFKLKSKLPKQDQSLKELIKSKSNLEKKIDKLKAELDKVTAKIRQLS